MKSKTEIRYFKVRDILQHVKIEEKRIVRMMQGLAKNQDKELQILASIWSHNKDIQVELRMLSDNLRNEIEEEREEELKAIEL